MKISKNSFISKNSVVLGSVEIADNVSIWPMVVIRADVDKVIIGENSNIQDGSVLHPNHNKPVIIGKNVTVGHKALVHGCTIGNNCLIGMGAIILDGAIIEDNCIVAAGSLVAPNKVVKANTLVMGSPARAARELTEKDLQHIQTSAKEYIELAKKSKDKKIDF